MGHCGEPWRAPAQRGQEDAPSGRALRRAGGGAVMSGDVTRPRQGLGRGKVGSARESHVSRSLPAQGSQPSTASPFKQDVFVYSASPGSESPSAGAAATPVIMSRSPTGGSREGWGGCTSSALAPGDPGSPRGPTAAGRDGVCGSGMETPPPQPCPGRRWLPKAMGRSSGDARPGQDGRPAGCGASPCSSRNPDPDGAVLERHPHVLYCSVSRGNLFPF